MIDMASIIARVQSRLDELGVSAAEVSLAATDSKDTIRNWIRAVKADQETGTHKASATTIKLNQIEAALGVELAQNSDGSQIRGKGAILATLRRIHGLPEEAIGPVWVLISGYLEDGAQQRQPQPRDQSEPANLRRE